MGVKLTYYVWEGDSVRISRITTTMAEVPLVRFTDFLLKNQWLVDLHKPRLMSPSPRALGLGRWCPLQWELTPDRLGTRHGGGGRNSVMVARGPRKLAATRQQYVAGDNKDQRRCRSFLGGRRCHGGVEHWKMQGGTLAGGSGKGRKEEEGGERMGGRLWGRGEDRDWVAWDG